MLTVEALIVGIWIASTAVVVGGTAGVMRAFAAVNQRPRFEYRGSHRRSRPSTLAAALHGWRELAHAHALLKGQPLW